MMDFMKALSDPEVMAQMQSFPATLQQISNAAKLQICLTAALYDNFREIYYGLDWHTADSLSHSIGLGDTLRWARGEATEDAQSKVPNENG